MNSLVFDHATRKVHQSSAINLVYWTARCVSLSFRHTRTLSVCVFISSSAWIVNVIINFLICTLRFNCTIEFFETNWSDNILFFLQVSESEGASLAASHGIGFCEVSVADNTPNLYKAFERLLNDSKGRPVKQRKFSVSKMIGKWSIMNF